MTRKVARLVILFIWLFAVVVMFPWLIFYRQHDVSTSLQTMFICGQFWPKVSLMKGYFLGVIFLTCYTTPLLLISLFYGLISCRVWNRDSAGGVGALGATTTTIAASSIIYRSKVKVLKMLMVVVVLFAFSWLPLYGVHMRLYFGRPMVDGGEEFDVFTRTIVPIAQWLGSSNSCVNPIVYCLFSKKYRLGITRIVCCCASPSTTTTIGTFSGRCATMTTTARFSTMTSRRTKTTGEEEEEGVWRRQGGCGRMEEEWKRGMLRGDSTLAAVPESFVLNGNSCVGSLVMNCRSTDENSDQRF